MAIEDEMMDERQIKTTRYSVPPEHGPTPRTQTAKRAYDLDYSVIANAPCSVVRPKRFLHTDDKCGELKY